MTPNLSSRLVPSFVQRRYTAKFVVSILFVVAAIGLVGYVGYAQVTGTITDDTRDSLESSATLHGDALAEWTHTVEYQSRLLAQLPEVARGSPDDANGRIAAYTGTLKDYSAVHVVDLENETVLTTTTTGAGEVDAGDPLASIEEPWATTDLRGAVRGDRVWISQGSYNSSAVPGTHVVAFAVRTSNPDRIVVLAASIDVRIDGLHQGATNQSTTIVDGDGEQVLRHDVGRAADDGTPGAGGGGHDSFAERDHEQGIQAALEENEAQFLRRDGTLYAYAPVNGAGPADDWVTVTSVPASDAYAVRDTVGWNVLLIVATGILTLGAVALLLGRQTVVPLARLRSRARAMEEGNLDVDLETDRIDEIGQLYGAFDSMRLSLRSQITEAQSAREEAEAERERVQRINRELETTADDYSAVMQEAAEGDLTARMDAEVENEAMAEIATEFNEMLGEIEETVEELNAFAAEVATASEQVTASSEEVRSTSEQISESVQEISVGAVTQDDALQSVTEELSDLSTTTEEIAASSDQVADLAEQTANTGEAGQEAAEAAVRGMAEVETESSEAVEEIARLEEEVAQIDELVERIQEISDQTNLLALNANIEASRSTGGDGDGGFGVVAQEVKELSQDAKEAAEEVEERLESIREQTRRSAEEVEQTSGDVDDASEQVQAAVDALEEIAEYAHETNTGVQEISAATEQQAASTQEVVTMVDEAAAISEETATEAEHVAAAASEQTDALASVSGAASDLSEQATRLSEALDRFDTDADRPGTVGSDGDDPVEDFDAFDPGVDAADFGADTATSEDGVGGETAADSPADRPTPDGAPETRSTGETPATNASTRWAATADDEEDGAAHDGAGTVRTGEDGFDFGPDEFEDPYDAADAGQAADTSGTADGTGRAADGDPADHDLTDLAAVGEREVEALRAAGFETVEDVRDASHEELAAVDGIGDALATLIETDLDGT